MATQQMPPIMIAPGMLANESVCYSATMISANGIFARESPLSYSLPILLLQVVLIAVSCRLLMLLFKPLNMSRIFSEFIVGIILGPSIMGRFKWFRGLIFVNTTLVLLEVLGNVGLLYFAFTVGLKIDLMVIQKSAKKAFLIVISSIVLPLLIGVAFSTFLHDKTTMNYDMFAIFLCTSLSFTALPVLSTILSEIGLLDTDMGKIAQSAALFSNVFGVALLAILSSLEERQSVYTTIFKMIVGGIIFVGFSIFVIRPGISWLARRCTSEDEKYTFTIPIILGGVMVFGLITGFMGLQPAFGGFVFGLVFPTCPLAVTIVEMLEDFNTDFLLPLFFVTSGFKTNVSKIQGASTWLTLIIASVFSFVGKVAGTVLVALSVNMPFREGLALGFLMNSKGIIELIGLNHGKDQRVIDDTAYAMMMVMTIFMDAIIAPLVLKIYRPVRSSVPYKRRTIQTTETDAELRILACIHTPRNAPTIINLLEAFHSTKETLISVFSLHLVELTGHGSATLVVHNSQQTERTATNIMQLQSDQIANAFETLEQHSSFASVQSLTFISQYSTMHEEICNMAEDKQVSFIIVPFHMQLTVDGGMDSANTEIQDLNKKVLANAHCSVGILVDRGLKSLITSQVSYKIGVLFFGGPDDREALSYALRMSEYPGNSLHVIRFFPGPNAVEPVMDPSQDMNDTWSLTMERVVNNMEETVMATRKLDHIHDLLVVGRREGPYTECCQCPILGLSGELGLIGDFLASKDFEGAASVLVVQQYVGRGQKDD